MNQFPIDWVKVGNDKYQSIQHAIWCVFLRKMGYSVQYRPIDLIHTPPKYVQDTRCAPPGSKRYTPMCYAEGLGYFDARPDSEHAEDVLLATMLVQDRHMPVYIAAGVPILPTPEAEVLITAILPERRPAYQQRLRFDGKHLRIGTKGSAPEYRHPKLIDQLCKAEAWATITGALPPNPGSSGWLMTEVESDTSAEKTAEPTSQRS